MSIEDYNTDAIDLAYDYLDSYNSSSGTGSETNETANKCYVIDEVDDFTIESITPGEVCTIETAQSYGIFGKDQYFNSLLQERNDVKTYSTGSDVNSTYSLCHAMNGTAYTNCALSTRNPWKTLNESVNEDGSRYCMLPSDIPLPDSMVYNDDTGVIVTKPTDIPFTASKNDMCKIRWYDWFSIPDYHLGNVYSSNVDGKCMKPCKIGTIPTEGVKCINRESFKRGYYQKDFWYLPISLILLLGSTKETLLEKHKQEIANMRSKMSGVSMDYEIYNTIMTDEKTQNDIYETIQADLKYHITELLTKPFDDTNIIVPSKAIQSLSTVQTIMSKENILSAYKIAAKYFILSTTPDKEEEFTKWKDDLADINRYNVTDDKFYKQLLILKKACNVLFDNKTPYSRDIVLYSINMDLEPGEVVKQPIVFSITEKDSILAMSTNTAEIPIDKMDLMGQAKKERSDMLVDIEQSDGDGGDGEEITQLDAPDEIDTTLALNRKKSSKSNTSSTVAQIFAIFVIVLFAMLVIAVFVIVGNFFWYYIAEFLNMAIISFAYLLYGMRDLFRMKWTPSALNMEIAELQKTFVNKKIMTDLTRFKA